MVRINIVIDGDIIFSSNNLHNYKGINIEPQDIILSKAVDVQMNHVLSVNDQDMNLIKDLTDY